MDFFNFVTERLAVGGRPHTPDNIDKLLAAGITTIISVTDEGSDAVLIVGKGVEYLYNPTADDGISKPDSWFKRTIEFALPRLAIPHRKVFVHCSAGINRGPSSGFAILRALGLSHRVALGLINIARPITLGGVRYSPDADRAVQTLGYV